MKKVILFFALLTPFLSGAQILTTLDGVVSYDVINSNSFTSSFSSGRSSIASLRFGANFNFRVFDKGFMKTGLRYARQSDVFISFTPSTTTSDEINEYYLEMPLIFRHEFKQGSYTPYIEIGGSTHLFLNGVRKLNSFGMLTEEDFDPPYLNGKRFRFAIVIALGLQFKMSTHHLIFFQPTMRRFLPIDLGFNSSLVTTNIGFEVGIRRVLQFVDDN